jgi:TM2 domain-containing membrane protein YozV
MTDSIPALSGSKFSDDSPFNFYKTHQPQKQKALILCLLLGLFGAHRFYLHQNSTGAAYLLFCWTLIPVLFSLIDAIFLAQMSDEEFQEEYCLVK